ncbi:MAG: hypothetical protein Q9169_002393 [Polycauliona sp. 2 TL-2023]
MQTIKYEDITFKETLVGFVQEPNGRGTLDIVWSCLTVIILNTWTVLHVNIPPAEWNTWHVYLHKLKWAFTVLLIPEGILAISFNQWRHARSSIPKMRDFVPGWTIHHGFYAEMGGFKVVDEKTGQRYSFRTPQLHWLAMQGLITMPAITKKEIQDKSKASRLAKALALLQSAQFLVSSLARVVQRLPLTTFEIGTLPFIGCTWLTYFFWWNKVVDLETSTVIYTPDLSKENLRRLAEATCFGKKSGSWYRPAVKEIHSKGWDFYFFEKSTDMRTLSLIRGNAFVPKELHDVVQRSVAETRVAAWYLPSVSEFEAAEWDNVNDIVLVLAGWFFNGLHLAAWTNRFPTEVESLLWKISVCLMLGYIAFSMPIAVLLSWLPPGSVYKDLPLWVIIPCYAITRWYLMVEVMVGLRAVPPDVFRSVDWTRYIPSIS